MNGNNEIGIDKILRDEIIDNYVFKYELLDCMKRNNLRDWGITDEEIKQKNIENLKNGVGTLEAEYKTSIGNITIYTDIQKGDIIILKSDKTKNRSSDEADKQYTQDTH